MEPLIVQSTTNTPAVRFNPQSNKFQLSGVSLPENVMEFYQPVLDWLMEYFNSPNPESIFEFKFSYLNTASSKMVSNIFKILDEQYTEGQKISIAWYYDLEDAEIREFGQDLSEMFEIPVEFLIAE